MAPRIIIPDAAILVLSQDGSSNDDLSAYFERQLTLRDLFFGEIDASRIPSYNIIDTIFWILVWEFDYFDAAGVSK